MERGVSAASPLRRFFVLRHRDPSGVAGTGRIVEGVVFPCGKVVLKWRLPTSSLVIFENFTEFRDIYLMAHPTANELIFVDPETESG